MNEIEKVSQKFSNYMLIEHILDQLSIGNSSVISSNNIMIINNIALEIYNTEELDDNSIKCLKEILMICNIVYNRTDMSTSVIDDGFYDLLLEKYKNYDENFQVGSAVVQFKNFIENNVENPRTIAESPIMFMDKVERNEIRQEIYETLKTNPDINIHNLSESPVEFNMDYITKREHNTKHNHPSLVGTLDKCKFVFNQDAINANCFDDSNVKILERDFFQKHVDQGIINPNQQISIICELKYDGVSVEADCGLEVYSARTRGDTGIGEAADITPILGGYVFKQAGCMIGEKPIGVKFEAIITNTDLEAFNLRRGKKYKNCRTAIVGLFGASDAYQFRDLITLIPLALDRDNIPAISNRLEEIEFLNKVFVSNLEPLRYCVFTGNLTEILYLIKCFLDEAKVARNYLNFMFDGIVVSYLDENIRNKLGRKNFINKYSMAVKFNPEERTTIFRGYTYTVGQHGGITPMIHYDPVEFIGTIHNKSTGSSYKRFKELDLAYGDYINVTYTNDVMPYVSKLDCDANRNNNNPKEKFTEVCPICNHRLIISNSGNMMICPNNECPGKSISRMTNMFDKLNIKGFAEASFTVLGKNHLHDLLQMSEEEFISKLGEADGAKIYHCLNDLINNPIKDYKIMGSLGFTGLASKKWKLVLNLITIKDLFDAFCNGVNYFEATVRNVLNKPGLSVITDTIIKEFSFFAVDIADILKFPYLENSFGTSDSTLLSIRFTGCRNKQLSELLCNAGFDADDSQSVSKKTDILIVPYEGFKSSKTSKVSENCKIIPIDKFISDMELYIGTKLL